MQPAKERKDLKRVAMAAMLFGGVGLVLAILFFLWVHEKRQAFSHVSADAHAQAVISYLLTAIRSVFIIFLGFSLLMVMLGWSTLHYLKVESREMGGKSSPLRGTVG